MKASFFVVLFCLTVVFSYAQAKELPKQEPAKPSETKQSPATYERGTKDFPVVVEIAPSKPLKIETDRDKEAEKEKAENEGRIATGTVAIAFFTLLLAVVTGVLAIFTFGLWKSTNNLVIGAEQTAERQLRAYISSSPDYIFTFNHTIPVQIKYTILNHGQTPAYEVENAAIIEIMSYPLSIGHPLPLIPTLTESTMALYPQQSFHGHVTATRTFSQAEISRVIANDGVRICILGMVKYKDAFGKARHTRFFRSVVGSPQLASVATGFSGPDLPINYELFSQHNDAT